MKMPNENPEVIALAKQYGFVENVEMGGAYFSRDEITGDRILINNGEADYPEQTDSRIAWSLQTAEGDIIEWGEYPSFRKFLEDL